MTTPVSVPDIPKKPLTGQKVANYIIDLNQALNECNSKLTALDKVRRELEEEMK